MLTNYLLFSVAYIILTYIVFRVKFKKDFKKSQRLSPGSSLLGVFVFAVHANSLYLFLPIKWPYLPQIPQSQVLSFVFIIMFGIGLTILFFSWFRLGTKTSMGVDKSKLQTDGLYKYSRNPQLVGYGIALASFVIAYFSILSLIWFLLYIITSYFMIKSEEEFLKERYNQVYKNYCRQVPRIIKI